MPKIQSAYIRWSFLLFLCFASTLSTDVLVRHSKALITKSVRSATRSAPIPTPTQEYNGKLVFSSSTRQKDGGVKLWTMNSDGSNPTQLTFESDRDPSLPSYVHVYDDRPKWSPDGKKIAFGSNRVSDPDTEGYTIYIMD